MATAVTSPVVFTLAINGLADTHGLVAAAIPEPVNCVVEPKQTFTIPVMVGSALIVTVTATLQPEVLV